MCCDENKETTFQGMRGSPVGFEVLPKGSPLSEEDMMNGIFQRMGIGEGGEEPQGMPDMGMMGGDMMGAMGGQPPPPPPDDEMQQRMARMRIVR